MSAPPSPSTLRPRVSAPLKAPGPSHTAKPEVSRSRRSEWKPSQYTASRPTTRTEILACIRSYETGNQDGRTGEDYGSVAPPYYGAYQFDRSTFDGVASRHAPRLRGVRPDQASRTDQGAMAWWLYGERGLQPWGLKARHNC